MPSAARTKELQRKYGGSVGAAIADTVARSKPHVGAKTSRALDKLNSPGAAPKVGAGTRKRLSRAQTPVKGPKPLAQAKRSQGGIGGAIGGLAHVLVNTGRAAVSSTIEHPSKAAANTLATGRDLAKGAAGTLGLATLVATDPILHPLSHSGTKRAIHIGGRQVKGEVKSLSQTYGPSFRGDKGAYGKLRKEVDKTGPAQPLLDAATIVAPFSSLGGKAARLAADSGRGGVVGKVGAASRSRPALRTGPVHAREQSARPSLVGTAGTMAQDAARRAVQKRAVRRSGEGKATLPAVRHELKPGEVAPVFPRSGDRRLRKDTAAHVRHGEVAGAQATKRHVADAAEEQALAKHLRGLTDEQVRAAAQAAKHGIADSAGARHVLPLAAKRMDEQRAAALAGKHTPSHVRTEIGHAHENADNAEEFRRWAAHPEIFDDPAVQRAAHAIRQDPVGAREALDPGVAAFARSRPLGKVLDVKTRGEEFKAARDAQNALKADAKAKIKHESKAVQAADKKVAVARAATREAAVSAKLGSKVSVRDTPVLKSIGRAGGKVPLRRRGAGPGRIAAHAPRLVKAERELTDARARLASAHAEHKHVNQPLRRVDETPHEYAARVDAVAASRGLVAPARVRSSLDEADRGEGAHHVRQITPAANGPASTTRKSATGALSDLGRETHTRDILERDRAGALRRGAALKYENDLLAKHGQWFEDGAAADKHIADNNLDPSTVDVVHPTGGLVSRDQPVKPTAGGAGSQAGDYVHTKAVAIVPHAVGSELDDLRTLKAANASKSHVNKARRAVRKTLSGAQATLLAGSLSWAGFQRVNDLIALTAGGALPRLGTLHKQYKSLSRTDRDLVDLNAGHSITGDILERTDGPQLSRWSRLQQENPTLKAAWNSPTPARALLVHGLSHGPTALLRADAKITSRARSLQLLHNLNRETRAVMDGFGPVKRALAKGDDAEVARLLHDPAQIPKLERAAASLNKIHGDWHVFTAHERSLKQYAAFYGFLRYSTRMAFYTLPVENPYMGLLVDQLANMDVQDTKKIIGTSQPWKLGAVYNDDGTVAADATRANPLLGPLLSINKPEQAVGLANPAVGIGLSYGLAQPIGLSDASNAYLKQFNVRGNPADHAVGGLTSGPRLRILANQTLGLAAPYRDLRGSDPRQQSDDSLPFSRRHLSSPESPTKQLKIDAYNKQHADQGGLKGVVRREFPLLTSPSKENVKAEGQASAAAALKASQAAELDAARRVGAKTPAGKARLKTAMREQALAQKYLNSPSAQRIEELQRKYQIKAARRGLGG